MSRDFDIVVFGATGFTGRLVAEYLAQRGEPIKWAIAGRSQAKLDEIAAAVVGGGSGGGRVATIVADATDPAAMAKLAERTRVVATTAGPFAKYGSELVAACANAGTHYADLTGEVPWMRRMIDLHDARARETGARIVHTCGFDSIPSDIGTWCLQREFHAKYGRYAQRVTCLVGPMSGTMSGGSAASAVGIAEESSRDRDVARLLRNPFALDPDPRAQRPPSPDYHTIGWDSKLKLFTFPFVMAAINTRVVRRSHALAGLPWGSDFVYDERMTAPGSARGLALAAGFTVGLGGFAAVVGNDHLRPLVARWLPKPGDGPSKEARDRGFWKVTLIGEAGDDRLTYVAGDRGDPGYASTARMLGESALCLAQDPLTSTGGVTTPSIAMGGHLAERLRCAGLTFAVAA